ncbi:hypothetical protein K0M31_019758 [Melipona bicolor]|uniref:Uncharacterized protein n=1 Tax=Melipona bicolor TaxID=60889 RepID=A0AA40G3G4_9HYME|nr:hypothetical protein K0M31_019758 [Melipona bicolor]
MMGLQPRLIPSMNRLLVCFECSVKHPRTLSVHSSQQSVRIFANYVQLYKVGIESDSQIKVVQVAAHYQDNNKQLSSEMKRKEKERKKTQAYKEGGEEKCHPNSPGNIPRPPSPRMKLRCARRKAGGSVTPSSSSRKFPESPIDDGRTNDFSKVFREANAPRGGDRRCLRGPRRNGASYQSKLQIPSNNRRRNQRSGKALILLSAVGKAGDRAARSVGAH